MAKDPSDATLAEFTRWTATTTRKLTGDPDTDAVEVKLLLDLMRDHLGLDDPAALGAGDIEELLLHVYPRKVTVLDRADIQDTVPALRNLLAFLTDTRRLPARAARLLERELDIVAPRFTDAVMDPSRWGMGRSFAQAMAADGVDFDNQAAMQRWIAHYNADIAGSRTLPGDGDWEIDEEEYADLKEEYADLKEAFGLPDRLPAMRLPTVDELASVARRTPLLATAYRLAEWAGAGRVVNRNAELTAADTAAAARELGIEIGDRQDDETLPGMPAVPDVTGMRDVPELVHLWNLALGAGFLEPNDDDTQLVCAAALHSWREGTDAEALEIWSDALTFMVTDSLTIDADLDSRRGEKLDFYGAGTGLLMLLFLARSEGLSVADANDMIRDAATGELSPVQAAKAWKSWTRAHGEPADVLLGRLAQLGAVAVTPDDEADGPVARLMPLGSWAVREQFTEAGVEVPLLPPPAQMTAADLVMAAEGAAEDEIAAEADAWLSERAPDVAARELLEFAAQASPVQRLVATAALQRLGGAAEAGWRAALDVREVRPYAKIALTEIAADSPEVAVLPGLEPEPDDVAWLVTDLLAAVAEALEPEELAIKLGEAVPKETEELMFGVMSRLPHPDASRVLTLIGKHHPDKKVAKQARRFAYKANSRLKSVR
jgi:hypothetical protein